MEGKRSSKYAFAQSFFLTGTHVILTSFDGVYTGSTYDNTKINKQIKGTLV